MGRKVIALLAVFAVLAGAVVFLKGALAGPAENTGPTAANPLPVVLAGGAEPRATFTPIPPPVSAELISEQRAVEIVLERIGSTAERASIIAVRGKAGDANISLHDPDYPVWIVDASGTFKPPTWKCCSPVPSFSAITIYLDAVDGKLLHLSLRDQLTD